MERNRGSGISGQAIIGAAAVLVGVLLLLDNFDVLDARTFLKFWPVILVAFGAARFFQSSQRGGQFFGALIALAGLVLLVRALGLTSFGLYELWPLIFVLIGISMLLGGRGRVQPWLPSPGGDSTHSSVNAFAVLGGVKQSYNTQEFAGGEASAIMGGCDIDLRSASIQKEEAVLSTFALWGGITVRVPPSWNVIMKGVPLMGGFEDKSARPADPAAKKLVVRGTAIMGGVEVKN